MASAAAPQISGYYASEAARGVVIVNELPKFDLEAHVSNYTGRGRLDRLQFIGQHSSLLGPDALRLAITTAKAGQDVQRYLSLVSTLQAVLPSDPLATIDQTWVDQRRAQNQAGTTKKEAELSGYKNNLIKESIRMGNEDLSKHFLAIGDLTQAYKAANRQRDYCTSPSHILDMCLSQVRLSLYKHDFSSAQSSIQKIHHLALPPAEIGQHMPLLNAALGLAHLLSSNIRDAALSFIRTDISLGSTFSDLLTPADIAVYGTLTSLASPMTRAALQSQVLDSPTFRAFLDLEPPLRRALASFVAGKYSACLAILSAYEADWLLDPHLSALLPQLFAQIRQKSLALYFVPFSRATLAQTARAFHPTSSSSSTDSPATRAEEDAIASELVSMIDAGALPNARLDLAARALVKTTTQLRDQVLANVLDAAEGFEREAKARLLRMQVLAAGLEVKGKGGRPAQALAAAQAGDRAGGAGGGTVGGGIGWILGNYGEGWRGGESSLGTAAATAGKGLRVGGPPGEKA